jgi:D-beta-D-heptose 7-phosphate kinase / D-beta-D-heptose 1-phosphate adenosyltransferase
MTRANFTRSGSIVYVLGDYITDVYQSVKVTKIAPDAPAPVWELDGEPIEVHGGAGNVVTQFAHLSNDVTLVCLGQPRRAVRRTVPIIPNRQLRTLSRVSESWQYPVKTRFVSAGHVLARLDEVGARGGDDFRKRLAADAVAAMVVDFVHRGIAAGRTPDRKPVVMVASDYAGGFWSEPIARQVIEVARAYGVPLVVDGKPRGVPLEAWKGATVVKLNAAEALAYAGEVSEPEYAARDLTKRCHCPIVATRGAKRPIVAYPDRQPYFTGQDFESTRPMWASGAGDCFAAYLAANLSPEPESIMIAAATAHAAGAAYVMKKHNRPVHPREAAERAGNLGAKIYRNPAELAGRLKALDEKSRIGLTNGCFDVTHAGHAASLRFAKERCEFLAVFLNSDSSYVSLRGKNPILWWDERAAMLAAMADVDAVVMFNELEPSRAFGEALGGLTAEVLVKGEEYRGKEIAGREFARHLEFAPEVVTLHTREIIQRVHRGRGELGKEVVASESHVKKEGE